jgi:hypothetical protein
MKNEFDVDGDVATIYLKRKDGNIIETIIDSVSLEKLKNLGCTWYAKKDYTSKDDSRFYVCGHIPISNKFIMLHRFLMDSPVGLVVDHINGNTLDNRISENLRVITNAQNMQNLSLKKVGTSSGVRGVQWSKRSNKWVTKLKVNGKYVHHATFELLDDAKLAIAAARSKYMPYSIEAYRKVDQQ